MKVSVRPKVCLVTNELFPLSPGGIGRMLYNFALQNRDLGFPADLHILVDAPLVEDPLKLREISDALEDLVTLHIAPEIDAIPSEFGRVLGLAMRDWSFEKAFAVSYSYYQGLIAAQRKIGSDFDIIEFPDHGGWAIASLEAKRTKLEFQNSLISTRLHSTKAMIIKEEKFEHPSIWNGVIADAERNMLRHADIVVGHVNSIIDVNANHHGLRELWEGKTSLEFPPIFLQDYETFSDDNSSDKEEAVDFIFSSRLQKFKRPDIFVRAAVAFLEESPEYRGKFRIVSYGWDQEYIDWLQTLVPISVQGQIEFIFNSTPEQRIEFLAMSTVVIPSDYESLCLFAYEASTMGRPVILNGACDAFGDNPRWIDNHNCLLFDGTVSGLVEVMKKSIAWKPEAKVDTSADEPYWLKIEDWRRKQSIATKEPNVCSLGIVILASPILEIAQTQFASATFLESALELDANKIKILFLLPRGRYAEDSDLAARITSRGWSLDFSSGLEVCPEMLQNWMLGVEADCLMILPDGYDVRPSFVEMAMVAMGQNPTLEMVGGHVDVVDDSTGMVDTMRCFAGEMPSYALSSGRIAPQISIVRKSFLENSKFDPRARNFWFEEFSRRACLDNASIAIAPVLAATMVASKSLQVETSKALNAGVLDQYGLRQGLQARLVGIETKTLSVSAQDPIIVLPQLALKNAKKRLPENEAADFDVVRYFDDRGGLIVHPLESSPITVAEIVGPADICRRIDVTLKNDAVENDGIEAAIARVPEEVSVQSVSEILVSTGIFPKGFAVSNWVNLSPGEEKSINLGVQGVSNGQDRIFLMSRLPKGASESSAHLVYKQVRYWPVRNSL